MKCRHYSMRGFGLLGVIASLFLASSAAMVAIPTVRHVQDKTKMVLVKVDQEHVSVALEAYYRDHGSYPEGDNEAMVQALDGIYIDFHSKTLQFNSEGQKEFVDPWLRAYVYSYQRGERRYSFESLGIPERRSFLGAFLSSTSRADRLPVIDGGVAPKDSDVDAEPLRTNESPAGDALSAAPGEEEKEEDLDEGLDPVDDEEEGGPFLPIRGVANDSMIFVSVYELSSDLIDPVMNHKQSGESAFQEMDLLGLQRAGRAFRLTDSHVFNIMDFDVNNGVESSYRGSFVDQAQGGRVLPTDTVSATPSADTAVPIANALDILADEDLDVDGPYGLTPQQIIASLRSLGIPIYWGFDPPFEEGETQGYTYSYIDSETGELKEVIIINIDEMGDVALESLAALLVHEGLHHFWSQDAPPLPDGVSEARVPDSHASRGDEGRSFDSIDEEFSAFMMSLLVWDAIKGDETDPVYDDLLAIYETRGERGLREQIRIVYDLPEF